LACAPARHTTYSTQTSDNALDCALTSLERRARATTIDFSGRELDVLTVTVANGQLQVDATGLGSQGEELGASGQVKREASEILQRCGAADSKS
jgi:hypothetical protein